MRASSAETPPVAGMRVAFVRYLNGNPVDEKTRSEYTLKQAHEDEYSSASGYWFKRGWDGGQYDILSEAKP